MKSSRFAEFGPPSVLRIEEVPIPEPAEGEALFRAKAAAMNPSDIADVSGRFKNTTLAVYRSDRIPTNAASAHCAVKRSGGEEP
jgi:NADPH:quinone reductase-like Zn-dependent oxidoreductase